MAEMSGVFQISLQDKRGGIPFIEQIENENPFLFGLTLDFRFDLNCSS